MNKFQMFQGRQLGLDPYQALGEVPVKHSIHNPKPTRAFRMDMPSFVFEKSFVSDDADSKPHFPSYSHKIIGRSDSHESSENSKPKFL